LQYPSSTLAWLELGDFTVKACSDSGVIAPVRDVVRPRRHVPVRESQWPPGWPGVAQGGSAVPGTVQLYIWFRSDVRTLLDGDVEE